MQASLARARHPPSMHASLPDLLRRPVHEARLVFRRLVRAPAFTVTTCVVLTLGLGITTALFAVVNGVLLRPLPYPRPERLVSLSHSIVVSGLSQIQQSDASFLLYERQARVFDAIGAYRAVETNLATGSGESTSVERVRAALVSSGFFSVLGVAPLLGRFFLPGEDRPGAVPMVVLSEGIWRRRFGGDRAVIGTTVLVDAVPSQVIGVAPAVVRFPDADTQLWSVERFDATRTSPLFFNRRVVARLAPGIGTRETKSALDAVIPRLPEEFPGSIPPETFASAHLQSIVRPLGEVLVDDVRLVLWILLGTAALLACSGWANVAGLVLVRAESRRREFALRTALGAGPWSVRGQLLGEAIPLAAVAALGSAGLTIVAVRSLRLLPPALSLPRAADVGIDEAVGLFILCGALFSVLIMTVAPRLRLRNQQLAPALKDGGPAGAGTPALRRSRNVLVVLQVALALVLLTSAGLMLRTFSSLRAVEPGFDGSRSLAVGVPLTRAGYPDTASRVRFLERLAEAARALPGVEEVAFTSLVPLTGRPRNPVIDLEDHPQPRNSVPPVHPMVNVSERFFRAMGMPLVAGRSFSAQDGTRPLAEAIVSQAFARRYWGELSPVGKRLRADIQGPWLTIVGVVKDVHLQSLAIPAESAVYLPLVSDYEPTDLHVPENLTLVLRSSTELPEVLLGPVRQAIHHLDPGLPTFREQALRDLVREATARARLTMLLLGALGAAALLLAAVGLYGVLAYTVSLRLQEIGVRLALGARPAQVRRMVTRQALVLTGLGVGAGTLAALVATGTMAGLLHGVSARDPLSLLGGGVLLAAVTVLASWIPARRASELDPSIALRSD